LQHQMQVLTTTVRTGQSRENQNELHGVVKDKAPPALRTDESSVRRAGTVLPRRSLSMTSLLDEHDFVGVPGVDVLLSPSQPVSRVPNWPGAHLASCLNFVGLRQGGDHEKLRYEPE